MQSLMHEQTIAGPIEFSGIGLHTGEHATVRILPAPAGKGIIFRRVDLDNFELRADVASVARVAYGFGGGSGRRQDPTSPGEGEGGGGGVYAMPAGVLEVTESGTRFIDLTDKRKLAAAALVGFCLGAFWARSRG